MLMATVRAVAPSCANTVATQSRPTMLSDLVHSEDFWVKFTGVLVILCVATIFVCIGVIIARQVVNDERCEIALGHGASFAGKGTCYPPRVPVGDLLSIPGRG